MINLNLNKKRKKEMVLSDNQREIVEWLIRHRQETAYSTWRLLFRERESQQPDRCIVYYDNLSTEEKINVEIIIARFFQLYQQGLYIDSSYDFDDLTYKE